MRKQYGVTHCLCPQPTDQRKAFARFS
jgi:hypothetical protein